MVEQSKREEAAQDFEARARIFAERGNTWLASVNAQTASEIRSGAQDERIFLAA